MDEVSDLIVQLSVDIMYARVALEVDQGINSAEWNISKAIEHCKTLHNKLEEVKNGLLKSYTTNNEA